MKLRTLRRGLAAPLSLLALTAVALPQNATRTEPLDPFALEVRDLQRPSADRPTFAPGEILVRYAPQGAAPLGAARARVEAEHELSLVSRNDDIGVNRYTLPEGTTVDAALRAMRGDPDIDFVEPNYIYYLHAVPNDGFYDNYSGVSTDLQKWAFDGIGADRNLNAEAAWNTTTGRSDVVIAVVDSGVDLDHPDISGNLWSNPGEIAGNGSDDDGNGFVDDVNGWDFYFNDNNPNPDLGDGFDNDGNGAADDNTFHGTFSASCAGATGNDGTGMTGAAWDCQIMAVKIFTDDGGAFTSDIANGITYAANNGADVINMSFGGGFSSTVQSAVNFAHSAGAVQVASAGNSNSSGQQYPASLNHVISVGASDSGSVFGGGSGDIDGRASFSQYGTSAVDVVAPGSLVVGAAVQSVADGSPGTAVWRLSSGTSFSGPLVAGLAALVVSRARDLGTTLTNDDIESIIESNTVNLPDDPNDFPNGGSSWDGNGRVDFDAAISAVSGTPTNNPPVADAGANQSGLTGASIAFDGTGSFDPDGDPIVSYTWDFGDGSNGSGATTSHSYSSAGTYVVTLTVSDGSLTDNDTATVTITDPPTGGPQVYAVSKGSNTLPNIGTTRNEDIWIYDSATGSYSMYFDGSDVGLGSAAIDGMVLLSDGDILLSLTASFSIPGLTGGPSGTTADDSDIVRFTPSSLGTNTAGVFSFQFDGSDVGLTTNGEDVDAISVDASGNLVISTTGTMNANGVSTVRDEDLVTFVATSFGSSTAGSFTWLFDGSDVGLGGNSAEDVDALHLPTDGALLLSTLGNFSVSGLSGADEDAIRFAPTSLGTSTSGSFSMYWDGSANGAPSGVDIAGLHVLE